MNVNEIKIKREEGGLKKDVKCVEFDASRTDGDNF